MPEDDTECESFTLISIEFLLVYEKQILPGGYLDNFPYKIANKQLTDYLGNNLLKD